MSEKGRIRRAGQTITQWWTETAQDVVDYLEALLKLEVSPAGLGKLVVSRARIILQLDPKAIAAAAAPCPLFCSLATGGTQVSVTWGTVARRQPASMNASTPLLLTLPGGSSRYVYAYADYDADSGQWTNADVGLSASADLANTTTRVYHQIGAAIWSGGAYTVNGSCGNVTLDPCDLAA